MSAENAINSTDVSNAEESAPSIETSKKSKKKLKLLCNPQKLPKPKAPKARLPKKDELSAEEAVKLNDYFFDHKAKAIKKARDRGVDKIDDWYRYFGDSTVYYCRKSGISVHMPDSGKPDKADCGEDGAEEKDSGRLEQDNAGDKD